MSGDMTTLGVPSDVVRVRLGFAAVAGAAVSGAVIFALTRSPSAAAATLVAAVLLVIGSITLARFSGAVHVDERTVRIVHLLSRGRVLGRGEFDRVVAARLLLPSRGTGDAQRLVFLKEGVVVASTSPLRSVRAAELAAGGLSASEDPGLLTPRAFRRRYPGAVTAGERALALLPALAVAAGALVAVVILAVQG